MISDNQKRQHGLVYRGPIGYWFFDKVWGVLSTFAGALGIRYNILHGESLGFWLFDTFLLCSGILLLLIVARVCVEGDIVTVTTNFVPKTFSLSEVAEAGQFNILNLKYGYLRMKPGIFALRYRCFVIRFCRLPIVLDRQLEPVTHYLLDQIGKQTTEQ